MRMLLPVLGSGARIADLASGSGAFVARLSDAGFSNLTSVERDVTQYLYSPVPCMALDLECPFAEHLGGSFDAVSAIEIIEHLSNPIAFLREIRALLREGGHVLISTPNICEWTGRVKFLVSGKLRYFDSAQYRFQRHVSPLLPNLVPEIFGEAGLEVLKVDTAGSFDGWLRVATVGAVGRCLAALDPSGAWSGECLVILARAAPMARVA
jgi:SAM-dependent methyltransferase